MRVPILGTILLILGTSCASIATYPRRACLYSGQFYRTGTVIGTRTDGARLFRFDDQSEGDKGYQWVDDDDPRLKPCRAADPFSAERQ